MELETSTSMPKYVGFWPRVWASAVDTAAISLVIAPVLFAVYGRSYFDAASLVSGPLDFFLSYVLPAIAIILFWIFRSATPGKMLISARIVDVNTGGRPTKLQCIIRYMGYYVSLLPLGLGMFWIAWDSRKQGWHDKLAGTLVVRMNRREAKSLPKV